MANTDYDAPAATCRTGFVAAMVAEATVAAATDENLRWPRWLCVVFRFVVSFFAITTLYLAVSHLAELIPYATPIADVISDRFLFPPYEWAVERLFGADVVYATTAGFIAYMSTALLGAALAATIWSLIDWQRPSYSRAHGVLRIYLRYLLASVAIGYGAAKVIPVQFLPPSLVSLVTPLGDFTRMRVLWQFMGTSTAYIIFTGLVEVAGGLLLLSPRTTRLGAMILAAAFVNVAMLNFGYEVGVQLNSTIYALMAITLLAPDARRLATAFFGGSFMAEESPRRASLVGRLLNAVVVIALLGVNFHSAWEMRQSAVQRPALYGIYDVEDLELDDVRVPATEGTRWRRVIIGERGTSAIQWTPDGRLDQFVVTEDPDGKTLAFTPRGSETPKFTLEYARDADGRVSVTGRFDDRRVRARLKPIDVAATFPLRRPRR